MANGFEDALHHRSLSALGAALLGPDPDRGGLEVDVPGIDGQGFGDTGAGMGEGLVGRAGASRKRRRSSAARYLWPRTSTSWRSRTSRDISLGAMSDPVLLKAPLGPSGAL